MSSIMFILIVTDLEKSQLLARSLEERVAEAERQRLELEEAQRRAEEARRMAVESANLEKAEREIKVCLIVCLLYFH